MFGLPIFCREMRSSSCVSYLHIFTDGKALRSELISELISRAIYYTQEQFVMSSNQYYPHNNDTAGFRVFAMTAPPLCM